MPELREHGGHHYAVQFCYAVPDDAWCVELSRAVPAPATWAENPEAPAHLPGSAFLVAVIPDEDPDLEPTVHFNDENVDAVPYEIMSWFMDHVRDEVERCRGEEPL